MAFFRLYSYQLLFVFFYFSIKSSDRDTRPNRIFETGRLNYTTRASSRRFRTKKAFIPVRSLQISKKRRRFVRYLFCYFDEQRGVPPMVPVVSERTCKRKPPVSRGENVFFDRKKNGRVASLLNDTLRRV